PFGRRNGVLRETRPDSLLAHALRGLIERTGLEPAAVDDVIAGCVSQAGEQGANIGRQGVLLAEFPVTVPASRSIGCAAPVSRRCILPPRAWRQATPSMPSAAASRT